MWVGHKDGFCSSGSLRWALISESASEPIFHAVPQLRGVLVGLVTSSGEEDALRERCEAALLKAQLKPDGIRRAFLVPFAKAAKAS
jgi:hypothetical protein